MSRYIGRLTRSVLQNGRATGPDPLVLEYGPGQVLYLTPPVVENMSPRYVSHLSGVANHRLRLALNLGPIDVQAGFFHAALAELQA